MQILEERGPWGLEQICTGKGNGDGGCGSKLLVEEGDIYVTASSDYVGDIDYYYTFKCPVCGKETDIKKELVPHSIQRKALEKYRNQIDKNKKNRI